MQQSLNWDLCIWHQGNETNTFLSDYFATDNRNILLIAGAGFDPRATLLCKRLSAVTPNIRAVFIREQRPDPADALLQQAEANIRCFQNIMPNHEIVPINILGDDNAVVGGRNIVKEINRQNFTGITDIVVDISAMSIGTSYPLVRYLFENKAGPRNIHLFVMPDAELDESILPIAGDTVGPIHGFQGGLALQHNAHAAAKLWLPQLAFGRRSSLQRIYNSINPDDTCPILPFPSTRPRLGDQLGEHYLTELEDVWYVDHRDIIYAAEDDPLDLYRTILRIDDLRRPIFKDIGGSLLILSPTGSKILALGALMAALERDLPVVYLESIGYDCKVGVQPVRADGEIKFTHIWLDGDAYSSPRYIKH